jgi:hypothetical protein|tara:strand:+ start:85 stop:282 length:198 start_codon:yes stop_codon:yes gene_type:complete
MKQDVTAYMKSYNLERLHSANGDLSPVEFENSQLKVSSLGCSVQYPNDDSTKKVVFLAIVQISKK